MKFIKKILKIILSLLLISICGLLLLLEFQMYKPVIANSKKIADVENYAMKIDDELLDKDYKIIGLGEATHGNSEFQRLKLDVLKTLIRDNGVSAIAYEMGYGEGCIINDYINSQSDMRIEEVFSHISFSIYHTEEFKELIEWMREYNDNSLDSKLEFYGFDLQDPDEDLLFVRNYLSREEKHPEYINDFDLFINKNISFKSEEMNQIFNELSIIKEEIADYRVLRCIDNIFVAKELSQKENDLIAYSEYRDIKMKDNVLEISDHVGYPIMITGHNGHVGYAGSYTKTMGAYLKEEIGDEYFVIGTDYFKTECNINTGGKRKNHVSYSADPLAYQAKYLGEYYLNFNNIGDDLSKMVNQSMPTGSLGENWNFLNNLIVVSVRNNIAPNKMYDGMIYVYKASPLNLLEY